MGHGYYTLDDNGIAVEASDLLTWAKWLQTADRRIAHATIDEVLVSTVFLGVDLNFLDDGAPLLFETMIFGGKHDQYQERYATRTEALLGHKRAFDMVVADHRQLKSAPSN